MQNRFEAESIRKAFHDYRNVLDVANKYLILFDGGIKILQSKEEFIYWGYLPDK